MSLKTGKRTKWLYVFVLGLCFAAGIAGSSKVFAVTNNLPLSLPQSTVGRSLWAYDSNYNNQSDCYWPNNGQNPAIASWVSDATDKSKDLADTPLQLTANQTQAHLLFNRVLMWCRQNNTNPAAEILSNYACPSGQASCTVSGGQSAPVNAVLSANDLYEYDMQIQPNGITFSCSTGNCPGVSVSGYPTSIITIGQTNERYWGISSTDLYANFSSPVTSNFSGSIYVTFKFVNDWHGNYYCVGNPTSTAGATRDSGGAYYWSSAALAMPHCPDSVVPVGIQFDASTVNWSLSGQNTVEVVGGSVTDTNCTPYGTQLDITAKPGQTVNFHHCVTNDGPNDMDKSYQDYVAMTDSSNNSTTYVYGSPTSKQIEKALKAGSLFEHSDQFTIPSNAANGTKYCQEVYFTPKSSTDSSTGNSSPPACVTVSVNNSPPPPPGLSITITKAQCTSTSGGVIEYSVTYPSNYVTITISPNGSPNPEYKPSKGAIGPSGSASGTFTVVAVSNTTFRVTVDYKGQTATASRSLKCGSSVTPSGTISGSCNGPVTGTFTTTLQAPTPTDTVTFSDTYNSSGTQGQVQENAQVTPAGGEKNVPTGTTPWPTSKPYYGKSTINTGTYTYTVITYVNTTTKNGKKTYNYTKTTYQKEYTKWSFTASASSDPIVQFSIGPVTISDQHNNVSSFSACDAAQPTISGINQYCSATDPYVTYTTGDADHGLSNSNVSSTVDGFPNHGTVTTSRADMINYDQLIGHDVTVTVNDVNDNGQMAPANYGWPAASSSTSYVPCWQPTCSGSNTGGANIQVSPITEYNKDVSVTVDVGLFGIGPGVNGQYAQGSTAPPNGAGVTVYNNPQPPSEAPPTLMITLSPGGNPTTPDPVTGQAASDGTVTYHTGPAGLAASDYTVSWTFTSPASGDTVGSGFGCGSKTFIVAYEPYFRVYGGDISAGNGVDTSSAGTCSPNKSSSSVIGYNEDGAGGYGFSGAGTQYGAYALMHIAGFATGDGSSGGPPGGSPTLLSLGNIGASPNGDNFGGNYAGNLPCIPNYYNAPVASSAIEYDCSGDITISNGYLPMNSCTSKQGGNGNLNSLSSTVVVKANGNVYVNGNSGPTYRTSGAWGSLQTGSSSQNNIPNTTPQGSRVYACGNNQTYSLAPGATSVTITAVGGQGGGGGAYGSQVTNTINIPAGTTSLTVDVGCRGNGQTGGVGYQNGGNGHPATTQTTYIQESVPQYGYSWVCTSTVVIDFYNSYYYGQYMGGTSAYQGQSPSITGPGWSYVYTGSMSVCDAGYPVGPYIVGYTTQTVPVTTTVPATQGGGGSSAVLNGGSLLLEAAGGVGGGSPGGAGGGSNYAGSSVPGYAPAVETQGSTAGYVSISSNVPFNSGSITSSPPGTTQSVSLNIPSLYLVSKGNIFVQPSISTMDGVYVAEGASDNGNGVIYTCNIPINQSYYDACNKQLIVNGAFVAGRVAMGRTLGSADEGAPGDTAGAPANGWNNAAEVFNYNPSIWLNNPFATNSNTYDAISNLPPVL